MVEMSDFIKKRLTQMRPIGATLFVPLWRDGKNVGRYAVSTIYFDRKRWTRVVDTETDEYFHISGEVDTYIAAQMAYNFKFGIS